MNNILPHFCGIEKTTNLIVSGNLISTNDNIGSVAILSADNIVHEIIENSVAIHMSDMPDNVYIALNESGLCGSMLIEGDLSGFIIYSLIYHECSIKPKVVYDTFHEEGYTNNLKNFSPYTLDDINKIRIIGQYIGPESIKPYKNIIFKKQ